MACLDTTFLVDYLRGKNDILDYEEKTVKNKENISVASPSFIELFKGLRLIKNKINIKENEISKIFEIISSFSILNLDLDSAIKAGEIEADLINKGDIIDIEDIMIAAICIKNNETLVTKNIKHFERIKDLKIESY